MAVCADCCEEALCIPCNTPCLKTAIKSLIQGSLRHSVQLGTWLLVQQKAHTSATRLPTAIHASPSNTLLPFPKLRLRVAGLYASVCWLLHGSYMYANYYSTNIRVNMGYSSVVAFRILGSRSTQACNNIICICLGLLSHNSYASTVIL
jgi:hypothetical protein